MMSPIMAVLALGVMPDDRRPPDKPFIYLVEAKFLIARSVEQMSQLKKQYFGVELTSEEKANNQKEILAEMIGTGYYRFIQP